MNLEPAEVCSVVTREIKVFDPEVRVLLLHASISLRHRRVVLGEYRDDGNIVVRMGTLLDG